MSSGLRLILVLTLWLLIFSVTTCAQTGAVDSGQLVLTLRAPHPNEETDIADPLDVPHALALYMFLVIHRTWTLAPPISLPTLSGGRPKRLLAMHMPQTALGISFTRRVIGHR